ncbi:hypothetical protein N7517_006545 [Penicillium concentricum]|uniref:Uncharacterized protein n=1 Tax=Penicillium concentricum TaxID=293559 RepID=A0A9W9SCB0_9EURO|nr:uncharacterized protein N7517_006545 [Penicillium concentricum]KAJ5374539.1 hypothetical protein N7517_006545 [Penicillium concentricum]
MTTLKGGQNDVFASQTTTVVPECFSPDNAGLAPYGFRTNQAGSIREYEYEQRNYQEMAQRRSHTQRPNDKHLDEFPLERVGENITPDGHVVDRSPVPRQPDNLKVCIWEQKSGYSEVV